VAPPKETIVARGQLPAWAHFDAWNATQNRWVPLKGQMRRDNSPDGGWNFSAPITGDFPRQPDRLLRVRARLDNNRARVSAVRVRSDGGE
jgi:hypothetical protein